MSDKKAFIPLTRVSKTLPMENSGDMYNVLTRAARLDMEMSNQHIGLRFPPSMECVLHFVRDGKQAAFATGPTPYRDRLIRDVHGCTMKFPDAVIAPAKNFGFVTIYNIYPFGDYDITGSITFDISDLVAVAFRVHRPAAEKKSWFERLFS